MAPPTTALMLRGAAQLAPELLERKRKRSWMPPPRVAELAAASRRGGEQAAAGKAILFVSSYTPELLAICDRVAVLARGRLQEIRSASDWTEESLINCAIGGEAAVV